MKAFSHTNAKTLAEASAALASGKAEIIAGGTDLIGRLKDNILPTYPTALINIKTIPGLVEAGVARRPMISVWFVCREGQQHFSAK